MRSMINQAANVPSASAPRIIITVMKVAVCAAQCNFRLSNWAGTPLVASYCAIVDSSSAHISKQLHCDKGRCLRSSRASSLEALPLPGFGFNSSATGEPQPSPTFHLLASLS